MSRPVPILLACLALASNAMADGWSTNWPSQTHPRAGKIHLSEAYTAVVERCYATGTPLPTAPTWYRTARTDLVNLKTNLAVLIPKFVDKSNKSAGANGNYTNYWLVNSNATVLPVYSVTTCLAQCQMPTNWFAYTPWRSLSGLGGNTNDTSLLYPHGYTNAYTSAGGTNYPSGRSIWYDTDYGYGSITTLLARLTDIQKTPAATVIYGGTSRRGYVWASTNTYSTIVAGIDGYWNDPSSFIERKVLGECSYVQIYPNYNYAYKSRAQWSYGLTNVYTNCDVWVDWSMNVQGYEEDVVVLDPALTSTFANVTFNFSPRAMNLLEQDTETAGTGWMMSSVFGSTNDASGISMPSQPSTYPTTPWRHSWGWEFRGTHHALLSYQFVFR